MSESFSIPADMVDHELSAKTGGTAVSIRDMLVLLGASNETLREIADRDEILAREPWRKDSLEWVPLGKRTPNGMQFGYFKGEIDWIGTRFEGVKRKKMKYRKGDDGIYVFDGYEDEQ